MRQFVLNQLKNIPGWRANRRLVVLNVDDYGNVRLASRSARESLEHEGVIGSSANRFDRYDTLETRQDLESLFEVLDSVRDRNSSPAKFTAYALSANPDFRRIQTEKAGYVYELLPATYERLSLEQHEAYAGAWSLWREGIKKGFIRPQFHGREHLNLEVFERKLARRDPALMANLERGSMAALSAEQGLEGVGFTAAFAVSDTASLDRHRAIIQDGLEKFEAVFGFPSVTFTPPAQQLHPDLYSFVAEQGVKAIDKPLRCRRRLGEGAYTSEVNKLGQNKAPDHLTIVRNVVFEPTENRGFDPVRYALDQVEAAFRWRKPAIISSHRVNFCGHIEPENRRRGLDALRSLLQQIVKRWPDVEFVGADELAGIMAESYA